MKVIEDCHYCDHAMCTDEKDKVVCWLDIDHVVISDSKKEAEDCQFFRFCDSFPKY